MLSTSASIAVQPEGSFDPNDPVYWLASAGLALGALVVAGIFTWIEPRVSAAWAKGTVLLIGALAAGFAYWAPGIHRIGGDQQLIVAPIAAAIAIAPRPTRTIGLLFLGGVTAIGLVVWWPAIWS